MGRQRGNVGTWGYPATAVKKTSTPAHLWLRRRGRQTGEWPPTRPAAERGSTRQECVHTSRTTTSWRAGEEAVENTPAAKTQTECVCWPRPLCYGLHSVALCECRGECFGSQSDGWLNLKGHGERNGRCEKQSRVIRIFLSNSWEVFRGLDGYISCCWETEFMSGNRSARQQGLNDEELQPFIR